MSDLKVEVIVTEQVQQELASRVRRHMHETVKKEISSAVQADIPSAADLMKLPGWKDFVIYCVNDAWNDDFVHDLPATTCFSNEIVANAFPGPLEAARTAANKRRAAKSKSIKINPKDSAKVRKLLRDKGIDFE